MVLSLEAKVDSHTLKGTGWWSAERGGPGEMPVHVQVDYVDVEGKARSWSHGFLVRAKSEEVLWLNPETGIREYRKDVPLLRNATPVPAGQWVWVRFDLMDDAVRRDPAGELLPRPAKLTRIHLFGNGWDFRGAVRNVALTVE